MRLNTLKPAAGSKKTGTRLGRGIGSGKGKTSWALWLTKKIVDSGVPCLWFTYEMNPWYLKEKLVKMGVTENLPIFALVLVAVKNVNVSILDVVNF